MSNSSASKSGNTYGGGSHQSGPNISNYEKALISAATSIYQQQRKGGGGTSSNNSYSGGKFMPTWKQKRLEAQANRDPNKAIVVSLKYLFCAYKIKLAVD